MRSAYRLHRPNINCGHLCEWLLLQTDRLTIGSRNGDLAKGLDVVLGLFSRSWSQVLTTPLRSTFRDELPCILNQISINYITESQAGDNRPGCRLR